MSWFIIDYIYEAIPLWAVPITMIAAVIIGALCANYIKRKLWRYVTIALALFSAFIIIDITLFRPRFQTTVVNLLPFHSFIDAKIQPFYYREMVMNILLFFPLGLTLPFTLPKGVKHPVRMVIIVVAILSSMIEASQYIFGLGFCETDDVIMNTLGAAVGTLAFVFAQSKRLVHHVK